MTGSANSVAINAALGQDSTIVGAPKHQYRHRTVLDSTRHGPLIMIKGWTVALSIFTLLYVN